MIHSLQIYRGLAALLVLLFHTEEMIAQYKLSENITKFFTFGTSGVNFFFVLSGFIMIYIHRRDFGNKNTLFPYIKKRFIRIYPLYAILFFSLLPLWIFVDSIGDPYNKTLAAIIKSTFLIPFEYPELPHINVAWTLSHEMLFYLLFGLLIFHKKIGFLIFSLWFLGILLFNGLDYPLSFLFSKYNLLFFIGILAYIFNKKLIHHHKLGLTIFLLGNLCFAIIAIFYSQLSHFFYNLCYCLISNYCFSAK